MGHLSPYHSVQRKPPLQPRARFREISQIAIPTMGEEDKSNAFFPLRLDVSSEEHMYEKAWRDALEESSEISSIFVRLESIPFIYVFLLVYLQTEPFLSMAAENMIYWHAVNGECVHNTFFGCVV